MTVISKKIKKEVRDVSKVLGVSEQEALERALLFYSNRVKETLGLNKEFKELDELSDEALVNFENSL